MAQIINRSEVSTSDLDTSLMTDLQSVFTFESVDTENKKLFITNDTFIKFNSSSSINIYFGNSNGNLLYLNESSVYYCYYQIIKSTSGDIAVRLYSSPLTDNKYLQFAIVRVKDADNNTSWGIFSPSNPNAGTPYYDDILQDINGYMLLICDDNTIADCNRVNIDAASSSTSYNVVSGGFNPNATYTYLTDVYNMYTKYTAVNFKLIAVSPQPYNRTCTFGTDKYYCIGLFAMLDNDLT